MRLVGALLLVATASNCMPLTAGAKTNDCNRRICDIQWRPIEGPLSARLAADLRCPREVACAPIADLAEEAILRPPINHDFLAMIDGSEMGYRVGL